MLDQRPDLRVRLRRGVHRPSDPDGDVMLYGAQDNPHLPMEVREALARLRAERGVPSPPAGLGDVVATATKAVGVRPCSACDRRRLWLNRITPRWLRRGLAAAGFLSAHGKPNHHEQERPDQENSAATGPEVEKQGHDGGGGIS